MQKVQLIPYTANLSRGKTFAVEYKNYNSLENFCGRGLVPLAPVELFTDSVLSSRFTAYRCNEASCEANFSCIATGASIKNLRVLHSMEGDLTREFVIDSKGHGHHVYQHI